MIQGNDAAQCECGNGKDEILLERVVGDAPVDFHRSTLCAARGIYRRAHETCITHHNEHDKQWHDGEHVRPQGISEAISGRICDHWRRQGYSEKPHCQCHCHHTTCCTNSNSLLIRVHRAPLPAWTVVGLCVPSRNSSYR